MIAQQSLSRSRRRLIRALGAGGALLLTRSLLSLAAERPDPRIAKIIADTISVDMHNHTLWPFEKTPADVKPEPDFDIPGEMRKAGLSAICSAYYVDLYRPAEPGEYYQYHLQSLAHMDRLLAKTGMRRALRMSDLEHAHKKKEPIIVQNSEGAQFLEGQLERIEEAYQRGLRHLQLLHQIHDLRRPIGDVQDTEPEKFGGLTPFGAEVIKECNRLGIVVDMAHGRYETVTAAVKVTQQPFIVSHTALDGEIAREGLEARLIPRLISRDYAKAVADTGGIVGIWRLVQSLKKYVTALKQMVDVVGVEHTGIGTDSGIAPAQGSSFATNQMWPDESGGFLYALVGEMLAQGFRPDEIQKIVGGNYCRVFAKVTSRRS